MFGSEKFNNTSLFRTHFYVRRHFDRLFFCRSLSYDNQTNSTLAGRFNLYYNTTNIQLRRYRLTQKNRRHYIRNSLCIRKWILSCHISGVPCLTTEAQNKSEHSIWDSSWTKWHDRAFHAVSHSADASCLSPSATGVPSIATPYSTIVDPWRYHIVRYRPIARQRRGKPSPRNSRTSNQ
jgi:hypothetical protein